MMKNLNKRITRIICMVMALVLVLGCLISNPLPVRAAERDDIIIRSDILEHDLITNTEYSSLDICNSIKIEGQPVLSKIEFEFNGPDGFVTISHKKGVHYYTFKNEGIFEFKVIIKDIFGIITYKTRTFKIIVVDDVKKAKMDDFCRVVYAANHPGSLDFDPYDFGYLTSNCCACTKHTSTKKSCDKCTIAALMNNSCWFAKAKEFELQKKTYDNENTRSKLAGSSGGSCFDIHLVADYVHRTNVNEDVNSSGQRKSGTLNTAFLDKLQPADVLYIKSGGSVVHYAIVYDVNIDEGTITLIQSNMDSAKYGHCYMTKRTYSLEAGKAYPKYYYAGNKVERRRYKAN